METEFVVRKVFKTHLDNSYNVWMLVDGEPVKAAKHWFVGKLAAQHFADQCKSGMHVNDKSLWRDLR